MFKNLLILIIFLLAAVGLIGFIGNDRPAPAAPASPLVSLGGANVVVEIADTQDEQLLGLSGRESLPVGHGMLFVFEKPARWSFWMKDMKFPIDIIWLAPDEVGRVSKLKIVDVKENATPESFPAAFLPEKEARYVLEVRAGFFSEHGLKLGDAAEISGL